MFLTTHDITSFIDFFVNLMVTGVTGAFGILDSISFHSVSLLDFCIALVLIPLGLTIFVNVVHPRIETYQGYKERHRKE